MNGEHPRPSRLVLWLLAAVASRTPAEAVIGDILEDLNERRAAGHAPRRPSVWLNRQVLRFIAASIATAVPKSVRSLGHTVRDAARALRRAPAHSLFILLILAVGISAATVTFSVVDAVVFKPLPFDRSEEIVMVTAKTARGFSGFTLDEFWAIHDRVPGLDGVATMTSYRVPITIAGAKDEGSVMRAMADLFHVLRVKPIVGRLWTADDEARGDDQIAVLSYGLWQRRLAGDPAAIGQFIRVDDKPHRIVGVLSADAVFPSSGEWSVDVYTPAVPARVSDAKSSGRQIFSGLARLRPGLAPSQVETQIRDAIRPLANPNPAAYPDWRPEVRRWDEALVGDVRSWLMLLLGTVTLIVLIACFNAANLMLARAAQRARELAVRASLGASRRQLAVTLLAESLMLSTAACVCGLLFASWGVGGVKSELPVRLFRGNSIAVNGRVFAAAMMAALVTGVLFGTVPAWQASRVSVVELLKDGGTTATGARRRWRSIFLVSEIACIGVLLVVSTLFIMSFVRAITLDLGFDRSNLIGVSSVEGYSGTVEDLRTRFAQIPGVTGVAAVGTTSLPLVAAFGGAYFDSPLTAVAGGADAPVELYRVTPNYFDVMSIPFRRGSTWSSPPTADFQPMVVDEVAARRMFGDRDPLGQQVRAKDLDNRVFTIIGIVPYVLPHGPEQVTSASPFHTWSTAYYGFAPTSKPSWVSLFVRTGPPPAKVVRAVESTLASVAPPSQSGGAGVHVVDDGFRLMTAKRRFNANLMMAFAIFAMFIGAAGIYAVMASIVAQQTKEIGVRIALGATPGDIRRGVLIAAGRHLLIGLGVGLPAAWLMSRGFSAMFFQVTPTDLSTYVIVAVLLSAVSAIGAVVPARRASRVDPIISLRAS